MAKETNIQELMASTMVGCFLEMVKSRAICRLVAEVLDDLAEDVINIDDAQVSITKLIEGNLVRDKGS